MNEENNRRKYRSQAWFDNPDEPDQTAVYIERYLNYGLTLDELQSGRPIIGISQTGSDLAPCNRHHVQLAQRVKEGIRDAGGVPLEFPTHPIQETGKRPTAALDRNLTYLSLVEVLYGYPLDGVVLTTGCDKTTPASLMAVATVDMPAVVLSGGPMMDGYFCGRRVGSGTIIWEARKRLSAGEIDYQDFLEMVSASAPSAGHCNTMGTALSMNSVAEALGMSLPGCAAIPGPHRERGQMAYHTGRQAVKVVENDVRPSQIMTRPAFENAIKLCSAIGGSTNVPPHLIAIARHLGVELDINDWQDLGFHVPLLVNCQPVGTHLGEGFHRAGGVQAVLHELQKGEMLHENALTINGKTIGANAAENPPTDNDIIRPISDPLIKDAGFLVLSGNLFDHAIMKTSAISQRFRESHLSEEGKENIYQGRAIVFEGPEDYHNRINDPELNIDAHCILFIRNCGPVGYPGSAEVVNMQPPDYLIRQGVNELPCIGDGRQSGTSGSPSILNASPEAVRGSGLALLRTDDQVEIDLNTRRVDVLIDRDEYEKREAAWAPPELENQTPWQELYRASVGDLSHGACLEPATAYVRVLERAGIPRNSH